MNVLVCVPYRHGTPRMFVEGACKHFSRFTYPARELALFPNEPKRTPQRYGAHANARNACIDACLCPRHTHVLWLDVDLVTVPVDLIERLADITTDGAAAPYVFVERLSPSEPASFPNGGWFYDTGGFIDATGRDFDMWETLKPGVADMRSVGCCYLIPASVYRAGLRYTCQGDEVEHNLFFRVARDEMGMQIKATGDMVVEHAYLPKYGEKWGRV